MSKGNVSKANTYHPYVSCLSKDRLGGWGKAVASHQFLLIIFNPLKVPTNQHLRQRHLKLLAPATEQLRDDEAKHTTSDRG